MQLRNTHSRRHDMVMILIEEYQSLPTNTVYVIEDVEMIPAPAFTFCPKPSTLGRFPDYLIMSTQWRLELKTSTYIEKFQNISIPLLRLFEVAPKGWLRVANESIINGETIFQLDGVGHWSERTFLGNFEEKDFPYYFKCFSIFPKREITVGENSCSNILLKFKFMGIMTSDFQNKMQIDVYIHDNSEEFTNVFGLAPEKITIFNGTNTRLMVRPQVVQRLSKRTAPCVGDYGYSHSRCWENCFWEHVQLHMDLPCLSPSFLSKDVNLTAPNCTDMNAELDVLSMLHKIHNNSLPQGWKECNCPKRCNITKYDVLAPPTDACDVENERKLELNYSRLLISFPSKQVPYFREQEKLTLLDVLSNIGGIVGVCLGASLITLYDMVEMAFSTIRCKLMRRKNEVIDSGIV
ncbi:unnamed protein product [Darwinula stevensoni]|uniref:Uncharacterized protein n=1 Tax=Darwinula stevensoni TaxID=69355 RepID=A0A7R9AA66_9CRUS|nr:unnamed protein product [Darwinula stevensoni]CAG0898104.1 unnamed protein product [Darwinula stevensoni]